MRIGNKFTALFIASLTLITSWAFVHLSGGISPMSTFKTTDLIVSNSSQFGPQAPNPNERIFIKSVATTDTVTTWIQNVSTGHVGTGGNNESIPLGLRVNVGFAMGVGGTAVGRAIDLDSTCSKSSGTGTLDCEGILIGVAGGDTNNAIHVLTGGVLVASSQGVAVTAGPTSTIDLTATGTITANKATGTALSVPLAAFSLLQNGTLGTNSTNTLALNSSITTDVIMSNTAADQIFRMTNGSAGGHNYGLDNGGTAGFFGATLTLYDNTASRIAWQVADATGIVTITNGFTLGADSSAGSHKITNLTDPSSAQDAATKHYVDTTAIPGQVPVVFGDGLDSAVVFDGTSVVLGITPSSSTYTLTRDIFPTNMTVNTGVKVITNGWRIFGTGTLTLAGTGNINNDGFPGVSNTAGTGGGGGSTRIYLGGAPGGAGANGVASGSAGGSAGSGLPRYCVTHGTSAVGADGASLGMGGGGGDAASNVTGTSGDMTVLPSPGQSTIHELTMGHMQSTSNSSQFSCGSGGGGGGSNGSTGKGGGGGGSGATVFVAFRLFACSGGCGSITSKGGNGGDGTLGNASHTGGGGGGGGGIVIVEYETNAGITFSAAGGTKGAATGTGTTAGNGAAGAVIKYNLSGDGT